MGQILASDALNLKEATASYHRGVCVCVGLISNQVAEKLYAKDYIPRP